MSDAIPTVPRWRRVLRRILAAMQPRCASCGQPTDSGVLAHHGACLDCTYQETTR